MALATREMIALLVNLTIQMILRSHYTLPLLEHRYLKSILRLMKILNVLIRRFLLLNRK